MGSSRVGHSRSRRGSAFSVTGGRVTRCEGWLRTRWQAFEEPRLNVASVNVGEGAPGAAGAAQAQAAIPGVWHHQAAAQGQAGAAQCRWDAACGSKDPGCSRQ